MTLTDLLLARATRPRFFTAVAGAVAIACLAMADYVRATHPGHMLIARNIVADMESTKTFLPKAIWMQPEFPHIAIATAAASLATAGVLAASFAFIVGFVRAPKARAGALLALVAVDLLSFAAGGHSSFHVAQAEDPVKRQILAASPGDYRFFDSTAPDSAMSERAPDIWGYSPLVMRRYAELMNASQGVQPQDALEGIAFNRIPPVFRLLRCRYVLATKDGRAAIVDTLANPLPHAVLVASWQVDRKHYDVLSRVLDPAFAPRNQVLLEQDPGFTPDGAPHASNGSVSVTPLSTDTLRISAVTPTPRMLLITDAYSRGWRVDPLPGSSQHDYKVLPADYALMAVPLMAGTHAFLLTYRPPAIALGLRISEVALAIFIVLLGVEAGRSLKKSGGGSRGERKGVLVMRRTM